MRRFKFFFKKLKPPNQVVGRVFSHTTAIPALK